MAFKNLVGVLVDLEKRLSVHGALHAEPAKAEVESCMANLVELDEEVGKFRSRAAEPDKKTQVTQFCSAL